jgi:hypothetical protein
VSRVPRTARGPAIGRGRAALAVALLLAAAPAGCVLDELAPDVGPPLAGACDDTDSDPDTDVSFGRDLRPLFNRARPEAGCSCHSPAGGNPSGIELGGLDLGSYRTLRQGGRSSRAQIVVPGDPCASILLQKISDTPPFGARMPLNGPPFLSPDEIQLVHDWIAEGARDN